MQKQIQGLQSEIEKAKQKVKQQSEARIKAEQALQKARNTYQQTPQGWDKFFGI